MSYDDDNKGNIQAAIAAGIMLAEPRVLALKSADFNGGMGSDPLMTVLVPEGAKLEKLDMEKYLPRPTRKRGNYVFTDAKSFIEFVNREKTPETIILACRENPKFKAVFNGNEAQSGVGVGGESVVTALPGWGDYSASYACPYSPEWNIWKAANGKKMSQADFALFMEDNFTDVVQPSPTFDPFYSNWPSGNDMLAVSRGLEAKSDVNFGSAVRLDNGQVQFRYEETISGNVQGGIFEVPQKFAVGIPVFAGTSPWQIVARLRYRIERGGLVMWFDFERLFKITERAFDEAKAEITTGTSVPVFLGSRE